MRWQLAAIGAAILVFIINAAPFNIQNIGTKVIYGDDDRKNLYEVDDANLRQQADSTVALFRNNRLQDMGTYTKLMTSPFGTGMNLCPNEPFYTEENGAFCSGFLIAPDLVVSAGHCIANQATCDQVKFVFGFNIKNAGENPQTVSNSEVYSCKQLIFSTVVSDGEDFSISRLDRPVVGHAPLQMRLQGSPKASDPLVVMGHPSGLPLKISGGASVREVKAQHLVANLDTYGGNSGSAVFNGSTGEIEGVLVRGEADYIWQNNCRASNRCSNTGCRGEDVTLIKQVLAHIPATMF